MKLGDLCTIKTNFPDADFWLVRKGMESKCGKPHKEYNPEDIGIKVTATDIILPSYLYYVMMHLHNSGYYRDKTIGSLNLKHIRSSDIKNIPLAPS
jgi:hypothetical protein